MSDNCKMALALTNLDNGLYFAEDGWIVDCKYARTFRDAEQVAHMAAEHKVKNAAAAMIGGNPPRTTGFIWLTAPN